MTTPDPAPGGTGRRPLLFTPLTMRAVTAKNRLVFSPMVQYRAKDGVANDFHLVHYGRIAQGGFGIVFTEATAVEPRGRVSYGDLGLWDDAQIPAMRRIANYMHEEGALLAVQLAHAGRKASSLPAIDGGRPLADADAARGLAPWPTVGPTTQPVSAGWPEPQALSAAELHDIVRAFADAARRAEAAGADIIEIHGAHGYLLATFLSPISNTRNDSYGGDIVGRMRLPLEIAVAVRDVWPVKKPLFFRVSSVDGAEGGWSVDDTVVLSRALAKVGVDVVDCSSGGLTGSAAGSVVPRTLGFQVPFASAVRRGADIKTMAVGLILDGLQAEAILQQGDADLIAIGRQALYDPNFALHAAVALGFDPGFEEWPKRVGWWLDKREKTLALTGITAPR